MQKYLECDHCKISFEVSYNSWKGRRYKKRKEGHNIYCSHSCALSGKGHKPVEKIECFYCGKETEKNQNELRKTNNHFCSHSCSAKYNNPVRDKKEPKIKCKICGEATRNKSYLCGKHWMDVTKKRTLQEEINLRKEYKRAAIYSNVRGLGKTWNSHLVGTPCRNCGYDKRTEICHIKPISSFPGETTLEEINAESNLIVLCPNCHWEFDEGLLKIK